MEMKAEQGLVLSHIHHPVGWLVVLHAGFRILIHSEKSIGLQLSNHLVAAGNCGLDR